MQKPADISMTARYTAAAWESIKLPYAERFADRRGRALYHASVAVGRLLPRGIGVAHIDGGLIPRHLFMDEWIRKGGFKQVVEIASGFSPRGLMFAGEGIRYIEVDRPKVVAEKKALSAGISPLPTWVGADATAPDFVDQILAACDPKLPTAILNEGMSPYFSREGYLGVLRNLQGLSKKLNAPLLTDFYRSVRGQGILHAWFEAGSRAIDLVADKVYLYVRNPADLRALFAEGGWEVRAIHTPAADTHYTLGRKPASKDWLYLVEAKAG